jgi:ornithine carbamoyltransferase
MKRHFISVYDLNQDEVYSIFDMAKKLKESQKKGIEHKVLKDKTLAMVFEKPSLRTRVTFETGMTQLGGHAIYLAPADIQLGKRESVGDAARNLSRWVDFIMARVFAHTTVEELSKCASIPVINALSDVEHPCQIMADLFTIIEHKGSLDNLTIAYIGDGNNVCNSFIAASSILGFKLHIATPKGYEPAQEYTTQGKSVILTTNPKEAVAGADVVYTDVWTSMGQEQEVAERKRKFADYQVNSQLLVHAKQDHLVMHCLPAHRGEEITDEVIDGPNSVVLDEAENRLHVQKAILVWLNQLN